MPRRGASGWTPPGAANPACAPGRRWRGDTELRMRRGCGTRRRLRFPNTAASHRRTSWTRCFRGDRDVPVSDMSRMLQETRDQPEALSQTLDGVLASVEEL